MAGPRRDTRGIVDARGLSARVRFRRREPAPALRRHLEHYWLVDWELSEPYTTRVVPHPSVNVVFQKYGIRPGSAEAAGIGMELFTQTLEGSGRVCGVQFRPGGFRPFAPDRPVSDLTGCRAPLSEVFSGADQGTVAAVLEPVDDDGRVAALDQFLLSRGPREDPAADRAMELVQRVREDRTVRRVARLAEDGGMSVRALQRLFSAQVGVGPKWVILRYRIHEALERAESEPAVDWAGLAAELGYSDQAHLVRDFTATVGVPPTAYGADAPSPRGRDPRPTGLE